MPKLQYFTQTTTSGFPSPAEDYLAESLDLNQLLIKHPAATFFMRADGDGMQRFSIRNQDLLIVDKSLTAKAGHIILVIVNGELSIRYLEKIDLDELVLANDHGSIKLLKSEESIWGVVIAVIHQFI